jgi:hypothetical protein
LIHVLVVLSSTFLKAKIIDRNIEMDDIGDVLVAFGTKTKTISATMICDVAPLN